MIMLLSDPQGAADPIAPATRRVAALLAREKTGEILAHLHRRPYRAASEIARLEDIHVATAQRYLKELVEAGLLGSRLRQGGPRPTEEYWLLKPQITITVDLDKNPAPSGSVLVDAAKRIGVVDAVPGNIVFDTDPRTGAIQSLLILDGRRPRQVAERIRLSETLGRFLSRVPADDRAPVSVWDVMRHANLAEDHLPEVLATLGRFAYPDDSGVDISASVDTGSARPLDPATRQLFLELSRSTAAVLATAPPVPIVRLAPLDHDRGRPAATTPGPKTAPDDNAGPGPETTATTPPKGRAKATRKAVSP